MSNAARVGVRVGVRVRVAVWVGVVLGVGVTVQVGVWVSVGVTEAVKLALTEGVCVSVELLGEADKLQAASTHAVNRMPIHRLNSVLFGNVSQGCNAEK